MEKEIMTEEKLEWEKTMAIRVSSKWTKPQTCGNIAKSLWDDVGRASITGRESIILAPLAS